MVHFQNHKVKGQPTLTEVKEASEKDTKKRCRSFSDNTKRSKICSRQAAWHSWAELKNERSKGSRHMLEDRNVCKAARLYRGHGEEP